MTGQRRKQGRHPANQLTATQVTKLKEPGRYFDGVGLFLRITETGSKNWIQKLTVNGKQTTIGHGSYPAVSLAKARQKAAEARLTARSGGNPANGSASGVPTLSKAIDAVVGLNLHGWRNGNEADFRRSLAYCKPLYNKRIDAITSADVLAILEPIWTEKQVTAKRVKMRWSQVQKWAMANGYRLDNPVELAGTALPKQTRKVIHMASVPHAEVRAALDKVRGSTATETMRLAIEFTALNASRSGEVRGMEWAEVDGGIWTIPGDRIKAGVDHRIPLSKAAMAILDRMRAISTGTLVFPAPRGGKMDSTIMSSALRAAGVEATLHGFRSSFRDWCSETGVQDRVAEAALAHAVEGKVQAAYLRTDGFEKRREVMEDWANYIMP